MQLVAQRFNLDIFLHNLVFQLVYFELLVVDLLNELIIFRLIATAEYQLAFPFVGLVLPIITVGGVFIKLGVLATALIPGEI